MAEAAAAAFAGLALIPVASQIERRIRQSLKGRSLVKFKQQQINLINTARLVSRTYDIAGWQTFVIGVDDHPIKDLPLAQDTWDVHLLKRLSSRLSEVPGILNNFLGLQDHGACVPSAEAMSLSRIGTNTVDIDELARMIQVMVMNSRAQLNDSNLLAVLAAHTHDRRHGAKWFYGAGLGMIPLPLIDGRASNISGLEPSRPNAGRTWEKSYEEKELEAKITALYFFWALEQYKADLSLIEEVTGEEKVYHVNKGRPKWQGADDTCFLAGFEGSHEQHAFSRLVHFVDNEFYETRLTVMKVVLSLRIFHALKENEIFIREEVRKYRSMKRKQILSELKERWLSKSEVVERRTVLGLISDEYTLTRMGKLEYCPDQLNELCLDNFLDGNDGTTAQNMGADIFCHAAGHEFVRDSAWKKIVRRSARVLMCGEDLIITEPLAQSITIMRNDKHWADRLRGSAQSLVSDFNTPKNRLAAEILLAAISENSDLIKFLRSKLENNEVSYSFKEYSGLFRSVREIRTSTIPQFNVGANEFDRGAITREVLHVAQKASLHWTVEADDHVGGYSYILRNGVHATGNGLQIKVDSLVPVTGVFACNDHDKYLFGVGQVVYDYTVVDENPGERIIQIISRREEKRKRGLTIDTKTLAG